MSHTFEQFVRFSTDAAGLERILRLFQSLTQILTSYPLLLLSLLSLLSSPINPTTTHTALLGLRSQLALARRYFRLFRSLESFQAAQKLYTSLSSSPAAGNNSNAKAARAAVWLDVFSRTFNGMYLLLEASTILDAQRVPGLALWGPEREARVAVEGQRFWLFALVCASLAGMLRIVDVMIGSETVPGEKEKKKEKGNADGDEQARVVAHRREVRAKVSALGRRVASDTLDITLPGSIVGWIPASTGMVGLAMFVTTILTSMDIWERCGREVAAAAAAADASKK